MGTLGTSTPGKGLAATLALDPTPDCGLGKAHPRRGAGSSVLPWLPGQRASGGSLGVAQTPPSLHHCSQGVQFCQEEGKAYEDRP